MDAIEPDSRSGCAAPRARRSPASARSRPTSSPSSGSTDSTTVRDVYETLRERRQIAYTTVMTVMNNLVKKHLLTQDKTQHRLRVHAGDPGTRGGADRARQRRRPAAAAARTTSPCRTCSGSTGADPGADRRAARLGAGALRRLSGAWLRRAAACGRRRSPPCRPQPSHRLGRADPEQVQPARRASAAWRTQSPVRKADTSASSTSTRQVPVEDVELAPPARRGRCGCGAAPAARRPRARTIGKRASLRTSAFSSLLQRDLRDLRRPASSPSARSSVAQDAADARVRVLHVVDRVLARLLHGELEVDVEGRVVRARRPCRKRVASTPMASTRSSTVTIVPLRLDMRFCSPPSSRFTNCPMMSSSRSGSCGGSAVNAAFMRGT